MQNSASVVVIFKGGRLPSWHELSPETQNAYSQEHVDLMLNVGEEHGLRRIEGFKLMGRQSEWERIWVIEFPTVDGAEAWIRAEMAPPYGRYGYYEYYLSRHWTPPELDVLKPQVVATVPLAADAHEIPSLAVVSTSVVTVMFERERPNLPQAGAEAERGHVERVQSVAKEHQLMRHEGFQLLAPQARWHRVWISEFPSLEGAEEWIEAHTCPPRGSRFEQFVHLARKWAPEYFMTWSKS